MSNKHFIAIAAKFNENITRLKSPEASLNGDERAAALNSAENMARAIADVCSDENPRFDRVRFLAACGINR